jgi:hypothetical protein
MDQNIDERLEQAGGIMALLRGGTAGGSAPGGKVRRNEITFWHFFYFWQNPN